MQQGKETLLKGGDREPKEKEGYCPCNFFSTGQSKAKLSLPTEDGEDNTVVTQPAANGKPANGKPADGQPVVSGQPTADGERASGGGMHPG